MVYGDFGVGLSYSHTSGDGVAAIAGADSASAVRRPAAQRARPPPTGSDHSEDAVHLAGPLSLCGDAETGCHRRPRPDVLLGQAGSRRHRGRDGSRRRSRDHAVVVEGTDSAVGVNVGADVTYMITDMIGAGVLLRYAKSTAESRQPIRQSVDVRCRRLSDCRRGASAVLDDDIAASMVATARSDRRRVARSRMMKRQFTLFVAAGCSPRLWPAATNRQTPPRPRRPAASPTARRARWLDAEGDRADAGVARQRIDARRQSRRTAEDQRVARRSSRTSGAVRLPLPVPAERPGREGSRASSSLRMGAAGPRQQHDLLLARARRAGDSSSARGRRSGPSRPPSIPDGYIAAASSTTRSSTGKSVGILHGPVTFIPGRRRQDGRTGRPTSSTTCSRP